MKLATSTGDYGRFLSTTDAIRTFKDTPFKYINLEQTAQSQDIFLGDSDNGWKQLADEWGNAAAEAGVKFVVSHAPCLEDADLPQDSETYARNIRALRRSIEVCHILDIPRVVVHACTNTTNSVEQCFAYNKKWYTDLLDLAEKHNITIMTENVADVRHLFATGEQLRAFLDYMDHPLLAACWDTAHCNLDTTAREIGQYNNLIAVGDKLKGLHISDNFSDGGHHHTWPFAGNICWDQVLQGVLDVNYDGYFTFEASYTLKHHKAPPRSRKPWEHNGELVTKLLDPSLELKKKANDLLYETGKYLLETYNCFEE